MYFLQFQATSGGLGLYPPRMKGDYCTCPKGHNFSVKSSVCCSYLAKKRAVEI